MLGLQGRALVALVLALISLFVAVAGTLRYILLPSFEALEDEAVADDLKRASKAFHHSSSSLERTATDWAWFDDMWAFMDTRQPEFLEANANAQTLYNVDADILAYVDLKGELVMGRALLDAQRTQDGLPPKLLEMITGRGYFAQAGHLGQDFDTLVTLEEGKTAFLSARPIRRSDKSGEVRGTLIVGRYIDGDEQARLADETQLDIRFHIPAPKGVSQGQCTDEGETRTCYEIVLNESKEPAMALEVRLDRAVYRQGMQTVTTVALVLLAFCGLLTLGISALLQAQIIRPVLQLTRHIEAIAAGSLWGDRVQVDRDDEIGKAGEGVNHLLERVQSAQRELQTLNEELEGRVSARTRELAEANEQLRRDFELRKRLERQLQVAQKLESLGIMAGGVAHDFNNFLSTIRGNVALAIELLSPDHPARKRLEVAERGGERARQLTAQLLDLACGDGGSPAEVPLEAAYRELLSDLDLPPGIAAATDFPPNLPDVLCDPRQLQQVLHNLVQNAVQAMPEGGVVRAQGAFIGADRPLALANCPPGLLFVRITISDQGVGIPEDGLTRIFDPYMTTKKSGTGLGLTHCWTIVRRHGGVLTVESTVGVGTSFHVFLPAAA